MSDYVRFGAVCRSWHAVIKSKACRAFQLPMLMLCPRPFSTIDKYFLSLSDWRVHELLSQLSPIRYHINRVDCVGSIEGWLIMILYRTKFKNENFFWNPISGARVKLPSSQSTLPCHCENIPGSIMKFVASSGPTRSQQPCLVVSLCRSGHLAFCRATDKSWTSIHSGRLRFHDMVIMDGKLYAATKEASEYLMVFDIIRDVNANSNGNGNGDGNGGHPSYRVEKLVILHPRPVISINNRGIINGRQLFWDELIDGGGEFIRLAKNSASDELFMIIHNVSLAHVSEYYPTKVFRVFKLECNNANGGPRWVEVVDLGDWILFVSKDVIKFISTNITKGFSNIPQGETLERNNIYFAFDYPHIGIRALEFGVFSLTNKSIRHLTFPDGCYSGPDWYTGPIWFSPNL